MLVGQVLVCTGRVQVDRPQMLHMQQQFRWDLPTQIWEAGLGGKEQTWVYESRSGPGRLQHLPDSSSFSGPNPIASVYAPIILLGQVCGGLHKVRQEMLKLVYITLEYEGKK